MKYSFAVLLLVGVISSTEARSIHQNNQLAQQKAQAHSQALAKAHESESESDDTSSSSSDEDVQLGAMNVYDDGIVDALAPQKGNCDERLWMNAKEMRWQMDQFSRHLNVQNYKNAVEIAGELKQKLPPVHTWELLDKAFSFPRVRRYEIVQKGMDEIEHWQDNLNQNLSNQVHLERFVETAKGVVSGLNAKYKDGEFDDPANYDPRSEDYEDRDVNFE